MTGLGSFPSGLFLFPREKTIWNSQLQQTEMHPLWMITINSPGYMRIVPNIDFSNNCENIHANAEKISC